MDTQTTEQWTKKKCRPCEGDMEKFTPEEAQDISARSPAGA